MKKEGFKRRYRKRIREELRLLRDKRVDKGKEEEKERK